VPHVAFVHGMSNKPPASDLLRIWRHTLAGAATPLPLGDRGITNSLVYWAGLLYDPPDSDIAAHEGVLENTPGQSTAPVTRRPPQPQSPEEAEFIAGLRATLAGDPEVEVAAAGRSACGA
jgi:hypothetical protein